MPDRGTTPSRPAQPKLLLSPRRGVLHNGHMAFPIRSVTLAFFIAAAAAPLSCQSTPPAQHPERPVPPTRDPHTPGYVAAKELPDGELPPPNTDGNFILGPTHNPSPEAAASDETKNGSVI